MLIPEINTVITRDLPSTLRLTNRCSISVDPSLSLINAPYSDMHVSTPR